ncbi:MAG: prepilin-type N-terminal cleavage/methylation domain-containing protein [Acidobacteriota bacterium]
MKNQIEEKERGFTVLEIAAVVVVAGIAMAFAVPSITNAMRHYRLNSAMRQTIDVLNRAKTEAVAQSRQAGLVIDPEGRRLGVVYYQSDNATVDRIDFVSLPDGVSFQRPPQEAAPPDGVVTTGYLTHYSGQLDGYPLQVFNSRGFPVVNSGPDVVSIFLGNGRDFRAVTMSSVGGIRSYRMNGNAWVNTRAKNY